MAYEPVESRAFSGTATSAGTNYDTDSASGELRSIGLAAGTATATMSVTDSTGSWTVFLAAPANDSKERTFRVGLAYHGPLTVKVGGALLGYDLEVG